MLRWKPWLLVFTVLGAAVAPAQIYKWVDGAGVTHYSQTPPEGAAARKLDISVPASSQAGDDAAARARKEIEAADRAVTERRRLEDLQAGQREAARKQAEASVYDCAAARQQLGVLERGGPVYRVGPHGERNYLEDSARDGEIARMRREVERLCSGVETSRQDSATRQMELRGEVSRLCMDARSLLEALQQPSARASDADIQAARGKVAQYCVF